MKSDSTSCESRDILSSPRRAFLVFWLPAFAVVVTGNPTFSSGWRTIVWAVALGVMGAACLANAFRGGRVHCFVTDPFFLLTALVTLFYGLGVLPLGRNGWSIIG